MEGKFTTVATVVARCDERYFKELDVPFNSNLTGEKCKYHFPVEAEFWQGREINYTPFKIVGGVLIVLLVGIFIGWLVIRRQFSLVNQAIQKYSGLKANP